MKGICLKLFDYNDQSMIETREWQFCIKKKSVFAIVQASFFVSTLNNIAKVETILLTLLGKLLKLYEVLNIACV